MKVDTLLFWPRSISKNGIDWIYNLYSIRIRYVKDIIFQFVQQLPYQYLDALKSELLRNLNKCYYLSKIHGFCYDRNRINRDHWTRYLFSLPHMKRKIRIMKSFVYAAVNETVLYRSCLAKGERASTMRCIPK